MTDFNELSQQIDLAKVKDRSLVTLEDELKAVATCLVSEIRVVTELEDRLRHSRALVTFFDAQRQRLFAELEARKATEPNEV